MKKKIISRKKYFKIRQKNINFLLKSKELFKQRLRLIKNSRKFRVVYNTVWSGEPCLQYPDDLINFQEIFYASRPDYVIEIGVAWGGTSLFFMDLLKKFNGKGYIGVDIFIPKDLKNRLIKKKPKKIKFNLIKSDSTSEKTLQSISKIIGQKKAMIIIDAHHSEASVLRELKVYAKFIKKGQYLICCDTVLSYIGKNSADLRPWGKNNNPLTALKKFLKKNKSFKIDKYYSNKPLISNNFNGIIKKK
jgi:cephalosporin hydroxylase